MWTIFKVFIESVTLLLLFCVLVFLATRHVGSYLPDQGSNSPLNPWFGKIPQRRDWQPSPVFLTGKFHGQRRLAGYSPWGHKKVRYNLATNQQYQTIMVSFRIYLFTAKNSLCSVYSSLPSL